jgi:alpha-D-xyloside xylohydrolase
LADGRLDIYALSARAFRVRFTRGQQTAASTILLSDKTVALSGRDETATDTVLHLPHIRCRVRKGNGNLAFFDGNGTLLLEELAGTRRLDASKVQGLDTEIAEQGFASPSDERLYGTGQFQDGFLNLRGLSRRLTQVNTQLSLPFLLSSKGYGLLWHNTGMMELNPLDHLLSTVRVPFDDGSTTKNLTTNLGLREITLSLAVFECPFDVTEQGRYCFQLDVGKTAAKKDYMGKKHYVEIDGKVLVDVFNYWLPPTTSFFVDFAPGRHKLRVVGLAEDNPSLRFARVKDATVLRSPVSTGVDYIVIAGPAAEDIIAEYRRLTGEAPMMPKWAYGFIQCRERYKTSNELLASAREFRARKIPMDLIIQDWQYWGDYGWGSMHFNEADYPDPAGMIRNLHDINARFMLSVWIRVDRQSDVGQAFAKRKCYIPGTSLIDLFNPDAVAAYWGAMSHRLLSLGIDAWWQDGSYPETDGLADRTTAAGPGEAVRLQYPLLVARTVYEGQRRDEPDRRVMILSCSAFLGQQRFAAAIWSGDIGCDWETLKRQIPAGLNMMAAGYPYWTVDAGGFFRPLTQYKDPAYHELFLRWLQFATFLPLMRVHGFETTTEPWNYGAEVEARARALIELRYRLLPYVYSTAAEVTRKGSSIMRPLVMDFANDPKALDQAHSFMFGKAIHVAPVTEPGVKTWKVYLPKSNGGWHDFWTGEHRTGGEYHDVEAPLDRIPLHVRAGAIIPFGPVVQNTVEADGRDVAINVYGGADGEFELYEDEGTNYNYEKGLFSTIRFVWQNDQRELTILKRQGSFPGMLESRTFTVSLTQHGQRSPSRPVNYAGDALSLRL